jgi:hypothetical protein
MKLLTEELKSKLPKLGETGEEPEALVKLFTPWANWTWFICEYDPETERAFGLVDGHEVGIGYFSLAEIRGITGPGGLKIERDLHWTPKRISEIKNKLEVVG